MRNPIRLSALAAMLATGLTAGSVAAQALPPEKAPTEGQAVVTDLGNDAKAVTYWTKVAGGWEVVTTVDSVADRDSDAERHAVVRFASVLLPGQTQEISVPLAVGAQPQVLRISRLSDRIEVTQVSALTN